MSFQSVDTDDACALVYVYCTYMLVCMYTSVYMHMKVKVGCLPWSFSILIFGHTTQFSLNLLLTDSVRLACQQTPRYPPVSAKAFLSEFQKFSEISHTSSTWTWAFYKPKGVLAFSDLGSSPWCFCPDNNELILAPLPKPCCRSSHPPPPAPMSGPLMQTWGPSTDFLLSHKGAV